jgi:hypothetical protein
VVNEETQLQLITEEEKEILSEELTNDLDTWFLLHKRL